MSAIEAQEEEDEDDQVNYCFIVMLASVCSLGGFLFGYDTSVVSGAILYFKDTWPEISNVEREFIVSLALLGALVGSLIAGPLSDAFGRKPLIIVSCLIFIVGALTMALSPTIPVLMVGRVIIGLGVGVASMIEPVYLAEISPCKLRGALVSSFVIAITFGQLASICICLACGHNWRLMLGLAGVPALIQLVWFLFMPESQRWLAKKNRDDEALNALRLVYKTEEKAASELSKLQQEVKRLRKYIDMSECERYN